MTGELKFEAVYPHSPERVWRALTDPRELGQWLMANDFVARVGHKFQFQTRPAPGFDGIVRCEVIEIEPPRRLVYTWKGGQLESVVSFTLEPVANGTRLRLVHQGKALEGVNELRTLLGQGWKKIMEEKLPMVLDGVANTSGAHDRVAAQIERYEKGAREFAALMASIPPAKLDRAPGPGLWNVRQTALHIVDAEIIGATRLRMLAAQPGTKLAGYSGDVWARELHYEQLPLEPALELFAALRKLTAAVLHRLPESAWGNAGMHEELGEITLESCLAAHCEHAEHHMQEIAGILQAVA